MIEDQFLIKPKSMRHGTPDFTQTYATLAQLAIDSSLLERIPRRESGYIIPNAFDIGMGKYNTELVGKATTSKVADAGKDNEIVEDLDPVYEIDVPESELFNV